MRWMILLPPLALLACKTPEPTPEGQEAPTQEAPAQEPSQPAQEAVAETEAEELPPPYPRPGTTLVFENDVIAVWDVSWLQQEYPLHKHSYDLIGVSYAAGDRIISGRRGGRRVHTDAWVFQTNRANVVHVEEGASDPPMRAILMELKRPAPTREAGGGPEGLRQVVGPPAWQNNRAAGWEVPPGASVPTHAHVGDAVELVFDEGSPPRAMFVPSGTVHDGPAVDESGRAFIFELK